MNLTRKEYFAGMALQGLITNGGCSSVVEFVKIAMKYAVELDKQFGKEDIPYNPDMKLSR